MPQIEEIQEALNCTPEYAEKVYLRLHLGGFDFKNCTESEFDYAVNEISEMFEKGEI